MAMNVLKAVSVVALVTGLTACGEASKPQSSEVASEGGSGLNFNLGQYLQESGVNSGTNKLTFSPAGIAAGGPSSFQVVNNFVISSSTQDISAQYFIDAIVLKKTIGSGHTLDLTARADLAAIGAEVNFRVLGQTLYSMKKSTEMTYSFVRDLGLTMPYPILPALSLDLGGSVGGEVGFKVAPGVNSEGNAIGLNVEPFAALSGKVSAGFSAIFAKAAAVGTARVIEAGMKASAGIGRRENGENYGSLRFEPLSINALGGSIDLVASLGIGNILPGAAGELWQKIFSGTPFGNFEWQYPLVKYPPIEALRTPAKEFQF